jgi:gas vesicle protein
MQDLTKGEQAMASQDNDFSAFLSGFIIGGLVGAAVALIMAPQSGEETRKYIADRSIELRNSAEETVGQYRERATELAGEARTKATTYAEEARKRAEELAHEARVRAEELASKGQESFTETREKVKHAVEERAASLRKSKKADEEEVPLVPPAEG